MVDYITLYAGGSIECFNRFMQDENKQDSEIFGEESFYYLVKNLYDYNIIEMDNVTLFDCEDMYRMKNMNTIINDGRIINFEKENNND